MLGHTGIRQPEFWCSSEEDLNSVGCCKDKILTQNQLVLLLCFIRLAVSCPSSYIGRPCCGYGSSCLDRYVIGHFPDPKVGVKTLLSCCFMDTQMERFGGTICLSLCIVHKSQGSLDDERSGPSPPPHRDQDLPGPCAGVQ